VRASGAFIDVWDADSFDAELRGDLVTHAELIRNYYLTSKRLCLEREASDHRSPYSENPYAGEFIKITEHVMGLLATRSIRAWHYTRMTDNEVEDLQRDGIYLSTPDTIRARFAAQVEAGAFTQAIAIQLFADSPFQSDQLKARSDNRRMRYM
jgi:hypothetical protein